MLSAGRICFNIIFLICSTWVHIIQRETIICPLFIIITLWVLQIKKANKDFFFINNSGLHSYSNNHNQNPPHSRWLWAGSLSIGGCSLSPGHVGPDWCRGHETDLPCACCLGYFCTPDCSSISSNPPLHRHSFYNRAAVMGQKSPAWDSTSPFVTADPSDWRVCTYLSVTGSARENMFVCEAVITIGFLGQAREKSALIGAVKIGVTSQQKSPSLLFFCVFTRHLSSSSAKSSHLRLFFSVCVFAVRVCVYWKPAETTCKEHTNWYSGQCCHCFPLGPHHMHISPLLPQRQAPVRIRLTSERNVYLQELREFTVK